MSTPATCAASRSATFLQALVSGATPFGKPDGVTTDLFGLVPVRANLSARQAKALGLLTSGTCGQPSTTSLKSAALQRSLESKLQAKTLTLGSTLYKLTWKPWVTPSGRLRSRLRASVLRTSETGLIGWPTPTTRDWKDGSQCNNVPINALLGRTVWLAGWPTPGSTIVDAKPHPPIMGNRKPMDPQIGLADVAVHLAGWPTPQTLAPAKSGYSESGSSDYTRKVDVACGMRETVNGPRKQLDWPQGPARLTVFGELLTGLHAGMESGGQLNPAHSRWLQACPCAWDQCTPGFEDWQKWQDLIKHHSSAPATTECKD